MNLSKLSKDPRLVKALTGMTFPAFQALVANFEKAYIALKMEAPTRQRAVGAGRKGVLESMEARVFFTLLYYKTYPTFDVLAFLFGRARGRCCEDIHFFTQVMEKALGHAMVLPRRKIRSPEEFMEAFPEIKEVFLDGTERKIQRPKGGKRQRKTYSGKKKAHTRKNLVMCDNKKRILLVSPTKSGRRHDKRLADKNAIIQTIPKDVDVVVDTGFQGAQHPKLLIPKKGSKRNPLTPDEKESNQIISSCRVVVEHAIAGLKRFRVISDKFRNRIGVFDERTVRVGAGLWNFGLLYQNA
jgi:hypothetical protein